jgi:C_GCAxxG_C_C family probable redox protein
MPPWTSSTVVSERGARVDSLSQSREAALAAFEDPGAHRLNCAQAVVAFVAGAIEEDHELVALAGYMGGGSVGMGQMCGALAGAVLALGARDYLGPGSQHPGIARNKAILQQLIRDFEGEFGRITCRELTGYDLSTKEAYARFKQDDVSRRCSDYVGWVCDQLGASL